jgi:hypothetical protein
VNVTAEVPSLSSWLATMSTVQAIACCPTGTMLGTDPDDERSRLMAEAAERGHRVKKGAAGQYLHHGRGIMAQKEARKARLLGGGLTTDGEHGVLVFAWEDGERFALALEVEQFTELLQAGALMHTQARKLRGDAVRPVPVEMWNTARMSDAAILSLQVFGGQELRFEVSRGPKEPGSASENAN